jgi:GT2 family glycosyltransferase
VVSAGARPGNPFISVIVPTRDRPDLLADCLAGLGLNDYAPREIIVVDQSRDEQTAAAVSLAAARDSTLRYVRSRTQGSSRAHNVALEQARGELIAITNDDCRPAADWLAQLAGEFVSSPDVVAVFGPFLPLRLSPKALAVAALTARRRRVQRGLEEVWRLGYGGNMAFRREALLASGGLDEMLGPGSPRGWGCNDIDLIYRALRPGGLAVYNPDAVVWHVQHYDLWQALRREAAYARGAGALVAKLFRCGDKNAWRVLRQRLWPTGPGRNWSEFLESLGSGSRWAVAVRALYRIYCLAVLIPWGALDGWQAPVQDSQRMLYRAGLPLAGGHTDAA